MEQNSPPTGGVLVLFHWDLDPTTPWAFGAAKWTPGNITSGAGYY